MKKALVLLLVGGLLFGGWELWTAMAGSPKDPRNLKPVVVVSLAGYDKMLDNVATLGKASGNPELARELIVILKLVAIQQGLAGPDRARPWGIVVQADGDELTGCAFVPAPELAKLASTMEPFVGKAEDVGGGVYKIRGRTKPVYVKQKDGWAFFAYSAEALDSSPADPIGLLDGLNKQYDAAVRVYAANVAPKHRQDFVEWLAKRVEPYSHQGSREPDRVYELRKQIADGLSQSAMAALNDLETVTVGWTLDTTGQKTYVESSVSAKEGSPTARALASFYDVKSQFSGFRLPEAAMVGNWTIQAPPLKSTQADAYVDAFRVLAVDGIENKEAAPDKIQAAKRLVADLAESVLASLHSGRIDGGTAVLLKPDAVTVLAGGYIADGAKLTDAVKTIAAAATRQSPGAADWFKLDAEEYKSVHLHTISIPIPQNAKDRERVVSLIGEKLEVVVGIGPQSAYVAAGRGPQAAIKRVIDQSAADTSKGLPPIEFSLALGTTAKFVAATAKCEKVRAWAALLAAALEPSAGRDHVRLSVASIPNGVKYRVEVEEGILKLVGRLTSLLTADEKPKD